jgi:hypothetical protein
MKTEIAGKLPSQMGSVGNQPERETTVLAMAMLSATFLESVSNLSCYNPITPLLAKKKGASCDRERLVRHLTQAHLVRREGHTHGRERERERGGEKERERETRLTSNLGPSRTSKYWWRYNRQGPPSLFQRIHAFMKTILLDLQPHYKNCPLAFPLKTKI